MMKQIIDDLNWRYAVKKFDDKAILSNEEVSTVVEVARLTATSYGLQAMKLIEVNSKELREQLKEAAYQQSQVTEASHLLVFCALKEIPEDYIDQYAHLTAAVRNKTLAEIEGFSNYMKHSIGSMKAADVLEWNKKQCYIALGKVLTACANMKIDSCPMEGFDVQKADEILGLVDRNLTSVLLLPIGFRHKEDKNQHLKKVRLETKDFFEKM